MADAESISLEETNQIRISLGLKPIQPPSEETPQVDADGNAVPTADDEERRAVENLKALRAEQAQIAEQEALRKRLARNRDRKALNEKLAGHGLGEVANGEDKEDLKSWIKRTKKRERELAAKRAEDLESQDQLFQEEYTSKHLEGLRVGHGADEIAEGEGMILTLKDRGVIDEEDDDELISTTLAEKDRLRQNLENKVRKPKYDPYAEEYDSTTGERKILSKYDDEDDESKRKTFVISETYQSTSSTKRDQEEQKTLVQVSLDYDKPAEIATDYADPSTFKIKKPKKRKAKQPTNVNSILGDSILASESSEMIEKGPSTMSFATRARGEDSGQADDEELQDLLAQRRRQASKRRKLRPEDIIQRLREDDIPGEESVASGGLVIDDTSEFVRGIEMAQPEDRPPNTDVEMSPVVDVAASNEDMRTEVVDEEMTDILPDELIQNVPSIDNDIEPAVGSGLAATLAALKRRGELEVENTSKFTGDELERRERILVQQRRRKLDQELQVKQQKEQEREDERFKRMSQRDREKYREQQNQNRERREAQQRMQEFNQYKFNVNLEYKDEFGQEMSQKDAFKRLSHAFHGKSSGTMKKGKYLQKVQAAKQTTGNSSVSDVEKVNAQRERHKQTGSAYSRIQ